ncbi:MAG: hypothetical protein RI922_997 [Bacteroidota bacterium]|jgi:hypothetical protein
MRTILAEKLLSKIMNWDSDEVTSEIPLLLALASFKYDEYQQFSSGIRFIESLVKWLEQFEKEDERKIAYSFVIKRLIFISNNQVNHLVNMTFSDKVNPVLIEKTSVQLGCGAFMVKKISESEEYKKLLRRTLFIGLSDGARIDLFRRSKKEISNEQVFPSYHISREKVKDMISELEKANCTGKFNSVFLIDDFTASGTSYFRSENSVFTGKIHKFLQKLFSSEPNEYTDLIESSAEFNLHIVFYVATRQALDTIQGAFKAFVDSEKLNFIWSVEAIQVIENHISEDVKQETDFIDIISEPNHFDDKIVDSHFKKGKHEKPYLGFNEGALPLILSHNTPNNSLPILWFPEDSDHVVGLFPRITRHKDD